MYPFSRSVFLDHKFNMLNYNITYVRVRNTISHMFKYIHILATYVLYFEKNVIHSTCVET